MRRVGVGCPSPPAAIRPRGIVSISRRLDVPTDYNSRAVAAALARRRHGGGKGVGRGSGQRQAALQELHDRHASELWRFAMRRTHDRQLSEDIVQEVLLRAWKDPSLGLHDQAEARSWLFTASRNLIIDRWRSAASQHEQRMEDPPEESAGDATSVLLDRWLITEALASLSTKQRSVINAAYYEGRSIADISARLRSPEGTVKSRLHYGLRNLRLALQEKGVTRP
jgi:RNA polymerase sigma-70 factor (ECF subfamily)